MTGFSTPPPPPPAFPPVATKFPRPSVTIGATLVVLGGALMIAGSILNWFDLDGVTFNGFTSQLGDYTNVKGGIFDVLGALTIVFGVTQLVFKRVTAVGIISGVTGVASLLVGLKGLSNVDDLVSVSRFLGLNVSTGPGLYVAVAGGVLGTIGSVVTVAKKSA